MGPKLHWTYHLLPVPYLPQGLISLSNQLACHGPLLCSFLCILSNLSHQLSSFIIFLCQNTNSTLLLKHWGGGSKTHNYTNLSDSEFITTNLKLVIPITAQMSLLKKNFPWPIFNSFIEIHISHIIKLTFLKSQFSGFFFKYIQKSCEPKLISHFRSFFHPQKKLSTLFPHSTNLPCLYIFAYCGHFI